MKLDAETQVCIRSLFTKEIKKFPRNTSPIVSRVMLENAIRVASIKFHAYVWLLSLGILFFL